MHLLEFSGTKFSLTQDLQGKNIPQYAILSHTWGLDTEEVTYKDLIDGIGMNKAGFKKLQFCGEQAMQDGLQYFWIDTCCIDKSNSTELNEAITSMFRWYQNATRCYVYLSDVSFPTFDNLKQFNPALDTAFRASRWFTRGWTLQELIAPSSVEFFTKEGKMIGNKKTLEQQIHEVTKVAIQALRGGTLSEFDIEERFNWADGRQTTREEDLAYCLFGIFDVSIVALYGEGKDKAFRRLRKEISENHTGQNTMCTMRAAQAIIRMMDTGISIIDSAEKISNSEDFISHYMGCLLEEAAQEGEALSKLGNKLDSDMKKRLNPLIQKTKQLCDKLLDSPALKMQRQGKHKIAESEIKDDLEEEVKKTEYSVMRNEFIGFKQELMANKLENILESVAKASKRTYWRLQSYDQVEANYNLIKWNDFTQCSPDDFNELSQRVATLIARLNLDFDFKNQKFEKTEQAAHGTFDWIARFDSSIVRTTRKLEEKEEEVYRRDNEENLKRRTQATRQFRSFLKDERRVYMVLGKPGSGKSTLMKSLVESQQVTNELESWALEQKKKLIKAHFFFSVTFGSGGLQIEEAMWRDILIQVLRSHPELGLILLRDEPTLNDGTSIGYKTIQRAVTALFSGKDGIAEKYCICLLIDGLDEFRPSRKQTQQVNEEIFKLTSSLIQTSSFPTTTKLILSSRPIPKLIPQQYENKVLILLLHEYTKADILQLSFSKLNQSTLTHRDLYIPEYEELSELIAMRAEGIFIWAIWVIKDLITACTHGEDGTQFRERIKTTSQNMSEIYVGTLNRVASASRSQSALLLYLAAFKPAGFRLNGLVCSWLENLQNPGFPMNIPVELYDQRKSQKLLQEANLKVEALTHGMMRITEIPYLNEGQGNISQESKTFFSKEIVFLHRSTQDFVRDVLEGNEEVHELANSWLFGKKDKIEKIFEIADNNLSIFVRIFVAEMRFGVPRKDNEGNPHDDFMDYGYWSSNPNGVQQKRITGATDFGHFSETQRMFYINRWSGQSVFLQSLWRAKVDMEQWFLFGEVCISLSWAMYVGFDITQELPGRRLGCALASQLAVIAAARPDDVKIGIVLWLLKNKCTSPDSMLTVFTSEHVEEICNELLMKANKRSPHTGRKCYCGENEEPVIYKNGRRVPIWLIILRLYGHAGRNAKKYLLRKDFETFCRLLEVWLEESHPSDAILVLAADSQCLFDGNYADENLYYVEIEQIARSIRRSEDVAKLELKLRRVRGNLRQQGQSQRIHGLLRSLKIRKNDTPSRPNIRQRYRHLSDDKLADSDWAVYGVISSEHELVGDFHCNIVS